MQSLPKPPLEPLFLRVLRNKMFATAVRSQFTVSQEHVASVWCARDNHKDSVESQRAWSITEPTGKSKQQNQHCQVCYLF